MATKKSPAKKKEVTPTPDPLYVEGKEVGVAPVNVNYEVFEVGDKVRSLDFPDDPTKDDKCFAEGEITNIVTIQGCPRYEITVSRRVFNGREMMVADAEEPIKVYPPINGTPKIDGVCNGVRKL